MPHGDTVPRNPDHPLYQIRKAAGLRYTDMRNLGVWHPHEIELDKNNAITRRVLEIYARYDPQQRTPQQLLDAYRDYRGLPRIEVKNRYNGYRKPLTGTCADCGQKNIELVASNTYGLDLCRNCYSRRNYHRYRDQPVPDAPRLGAYGHSDQIDEAGWDEEVEQHHQERLLVRLGRDALNQHLKTTGNPRLTRPISVLREELETIYREEAA